MRLARSMILAVILAGFSHGALAIEGSRYSFETPGLTDGDDLAPYSNDDVQFTTLDHSAVYTTYLAEFSLPVNTIQFYWEVGEPVSTPDMVYLGLVFEDYPRIAGTFYDAAGNDLESFWQGGSSNNAGHLISTSIFDKVEFLLGGPRVRYLDRTGCAADDAACGVEVIQTLPIEISQFIYGVNETALAAVPEPETYAMLLAGLGLLGFTYRRRMQQ